MRRIQGLAAVSQGERFQQLVEQRRNELAGLSWGRWALLRRLWKEAGDYVRQQPALGCSTVVQ